MAMFSFNFPMTAIAQQHTTVVDAKTAAEYDAEDDVNTAIWLAAGGILGVVGNLPLSAVAVGGAYVYQPVPPRGAVARQISGIRHYLHGCLQSQVTQSAIDCCWKRGTRWIGCLLHVRDG